MEIKNVVAQEEYKKKSELLKEVGEIEKKIEEKEEKFLKSKKEEGWIEFKFVSVYYGSHPEYGESDEEDKYLFHPSLEKDVEQWREKKFAHGHFGPSEENDDFKSWLEYIPEDKYIEIF